MKKRYAVLAVMITFALTLTTTLAATKWKGSDKVVEIHSTNEAINSLFKEHKDLIKDLEKELKDTGKNTVSIEDHDRIVAVMQTQYETMHRDLTGKLSMKDITIQDLKNQLELAYQDVLGIDQALLKTLEDNKVVE